MIFPLVFLVASSQSLLVVKFSHVIILSEMKLWYFSSLHSFKNFSEFREKDDEIRSVHKRQVVFLLSKHLYPAMSTYSGAGTGMILLGSILQKEPVSLFVEEKRKLSE